MPIEGPAWPRRSPWMPGAPPSLLHLQQRLYILTGSDEVPLSWLAFTGLSVKIMYAGPQKAAFPMAERRKEGEKAGERGRKVCSEWTRIPDLDLYLRSWLSVDVI